MRNAPPEWFAVDQLFRGHGGWFVGSAAGLSMGPYGSAEKARAAGRHVQALLVKAKDRGEVVRIVREALGQPPGGPRQAADEIG